jgi:hypothetical protein
MHRYTWTQKAKEIKCIIDYVITKQRSTAPLSDHCLVKGTIFWPWIKGGVRNEIRQNSTESREWKPDKFNIQLLQDESIKMLYLQL